MPFPAHGITWWASSHDCPVSRLLVSTPPMKDSTEINVVVHRISSQRYINNTIPHPSLKAMEDSVRQPHTTYLSQLDRWETSYNHNSKHKTNNAMYIYKKRYMKTIEIMLRCRPPLTLWMKSGRQIPRRCRRRSVRDFVWSIQGSEVHYNIPSVH